MPTPIALRAWPSPRRRTRRVRRCRVPDPGHVFGGLLVGQAVMAANETVAEDRLPCSVHASFLSSGRGGEPIRYEVERTRDGASFGTRRVVVRQDHACRPGGDDRLPRRRGRRGVFPTRPDRPSARSGAVPDGSLRLAVVPLPRRSARSEPIALAHTRCSWFEPRQPADGPMPFHLAAIAYVSDHGPTRAAREPHTGLHTDGARMSVSLDHSVWLHRPARIDQWLLLELAPVATGHARGLAMGHLWTRSGELVATIAQEVLLRTL
ncbi:MAG: thioesterase family protein [Ilumatobacteraceae bacterium]